MIEPNLPDLSVEKQGALLSIPRSSFCYEPKGESEINLDLMRLIDKQFLETQHQQSLEGTQDLPYQLRRLRVDRPNQVWCADITCLPMPRGFPYLVAIMGRHKVLAWRISITLEAEFVLIRWMKQSASSRHPRS